jgi:hypothetical protein
MAVKAVEMVRKIRNKHYEETKGLSVEEQIKLVKKKSNELKEKLKMVRRPTADNTAQTTKL